MVEEKNDIYCGKPNNKRIKKIICNLFGHDKSRPFRGDGRIICWRCRKILGYGKFKMPLELQVAKYKRGMKSFLPTIK